MNNKRHPQQLIHLLTCGLLAIMLSACSGIPKLSFPGVYRIDIPQGNIINQDMIDQLRPGLSKRQVTYIMGTPLVRDTFNQDRWDYVYSIQRGGGERMQESVSVFFQDGELTHFEGDYEQSPGKEQFGQHTESDATSVRQISAEDV